MAESSSSLQWNYYQILSQSNPDYNIVKDDCITTIQFEKRGQYLATGDQGGRVVIFERDDDRKIEASSREKMDYAPDQRPKFRFKTEYHSHHRKFDPLSDEVVSARINKVSWCVAEKGRLMLLSANDKKIKLWTIKEYELDGSEQAIPLGPPRFLSSENVLLSKKCSESGKEASSSASGGHLEWTENLFQEEYPPPEDNDDNDEDVGPGKTFHTAKCKKVYAEDNSDHIHSISNNSDGQTFISAEEYKINLWNLDFNDCSFNLVEMKPWETEERITSAEFHPVNCNFLAYGSSRGRICISDMRQALRCDNSASVFLDPSLSYLNHPYEKRASHISDVKFLADDGIGGIQFISRDHMNMKLWDMRMDRPIEIYGVHDQLHPRIAEMYDYGLMPAQFDCCSRRDGFCFATGSFSHRLKIFSMEDESVQDIKLDVIANFARQGRHTLPRWAVRRSSIIDYIRPAGLDQGGAGDINEDLFFARDTKLLRVAWHPTTNLVAAALKGNLIFYHV